jgi:hypothetical protein
MDHDRASDHQPEGNRHQYQTHAPLTQVDFLDIEHADRSLWREPQLSVTDSSEAWTAIPAADSLCVTMSREIAKQCATNVGACEVLMTRLRDKATFFC